MHQLDRKPSNSLTAAIAIALKVDEMDDETIQGKMNSHLKKGIRALCKPMEHPDRATVLPTTAFNGLVQNAGVHRKLLSIFHTLDVVSTELNAVCKHEFAHLRALEHV